MKELFVILLFFSCNIIISIFLKRENKSKFGDRESILIYLLILINIFPIIYILFLIYKTKLKLKVSY